MKVVVADTSPINYLILIDSADLLLKLYTRVVIPIEVFNELAASGAPPEVAKWMRPHPDWLEISAAIGEHSVDPHDQALLDAGELAAIRLPLNESDSLLLIDDAAGRSVAARLGVATTGTLGVLMAGAKEGLINLEAVFERLKGTNVRISQSLIDDLLADPKILGSARDSGKKW